MATSLFFGGNISQHYEDYLGAFVFEPFAADLAKRLNLTGVSNMLELGCGSGRLTQHIAAMLPAAVKFTATDLTTDMLSVAQSKVKSDRVTWAQADMMNLPFEDAAFDLVVCQFAVMLVPDQLKALAEIKRILKPGGKVVFSTWTDLSHNRLWALGDEVLKSFSINAPMTRNPGPFALGDAAVVSDMLTQTGFSQALATTVENTGETDVAAKAAYGFIYGLPISLLIQKEQPELMPEILRTLEEALKAELGEQPLKIPQKALVFEAIR